MAFHLDRSGGRHKSNGRWPANLVLQHAPGCQHLGETHIRGNRVDTRPEGDAGRTDRSQWRFRPTGATRRGYSDADGLETVEAWDCAPGCPVADLDGSTGVLRSGGRAGRSYGGCDGRAVTVYGHGLNDSTSEMYSDSGGPSRFFKQVGGHRDV